MVQVEVAAGQVGDLVEGVVAEELVVAGRGGQVATPGAAAAAVVAVLHPVEHRRAVRGLPFHVHGASEAVVAGVGIAGVALGFTAVFDVTQLDAGLGVGDLHVAGLAHVGVAHQILAFTIDLEEATG